jgi:hypothetical protein
MRKKAFIFFVLLITAFVAFPSEGKFARYFTDKAMRVDVYHGGTDRSEFFFLHQVREEPYYAGSRNNLIDDTNLGNYLFKVYDLETGELIYSRGYSTLFYEWQRTEEAQAGVLRAFHESLLFPYPKGKVKLVIAARDEENRFRDRYSVEIDPKSPDVSKERRYAEFKPWAVMITGPSEKRVDLLFIGDGYAISEMEKFHKDVRRFVEFLFSASPYDKYRDRFNIRAIDVISQESGPDEPTKGIYQNTILGCSFNTFGIARYMTSPENRAIRDVASNAPYDQIVILVNTKRYGGGGIFNFYSIFAADTNPGVFIHELGHAFAGLADEYDLETYSGFYKTDVEPWEPNITICTDKEKLKWRHLLTPDVTIPTPNDEKYQGVVGLFEGAGYLKKGMYRPYYLCRMRGTAKASDFCPVCKEAIIRIIKFQCGEE